MDSPEPNQTGTPISNFEDSPVFNFLNSLSPIKPARSTHIAQTFNSPSFASPPSVFASPHFSSQRESRFLRRHCFSGSSKPNLLSENGNNGNTNAVVMDAVQVSPHSADPPKSFDPGGSNENLESAIELPRSLKYDCSSPMAVMSDTPERLFKCIQGVSIERCNSFRSGVDLQETSQVEQTKEDRTGCDFKSLISDATDLLVFDSSSDSEASRELDQKIVGPETISINSLQSKETDLVEFGEPIDTDHTPHILSSTFQNKQEVNFPSAKKADKIGNCIPVSCKQQHGIRRRCLVFEIAGAQKKLEDKFNSNSSFSSQSDRNQGSSPCMLPGIGLHLNALAANTKSARVVKHKIMASGKQLISMPSSIVSSDSSSSEQKPLTKSLSLRSMKTDMGPAGNANEVQVVQHASRAFVSRVGEDFKESSPSKKRCKLERVGENEACKRCNCKKSKCLKLYCECFAAGVYCMEPCSCQECFNKPIHEDTVLATRKQIETRNPLAFAPKVIRSSESLSEVGEESNQTPASARHKRGCNCKKSSCLKKYCECYQGGVGCSINCRCEGCKNAFGRKDGSTTIRTEETEPEDEETETLVDQSSHNDDVLTDEEQYQDRVLPISRSFQICRMSVQLPFSPIGKIAQCSPPIQPNFEKHLESIPEDDDTPEILRGNNCSPISGVNKTVSPNGKRVSPPHSEFVLSPGRRNCRKLVLKSIPAFPSLNHNENGDHLQ